MEQHRKAGKQEEEDEDEAPEPYLLVSAVPASTVQINGGLAPVPGREGRRRRGGNGELRDCVYLSAEAEQ